MGKNKVVIFAGGTGQRMKYQIPKQFIKFRGVPILISTILKFEKHPLIDEIYVVIKEGYEEYTKEQIKHFNIKKVVEVTKPYSSKSGMDSIYTGLDLASRNMEDDDIVLIHDGVRPIISEDLITRNIETCKEKGNAISCANMSETPVIINDEGEIIEVIERSKCKRAKAPQTFFLKDILAAHNKVREEIGNYDMFIDNCNLMTYLGNKCHFVESSTSNIKITTQDDIYKMIGVLNAEDYKEFFEGTKHE